MKITLSQFAGWCGGTGSFPATAVSSWSIDTRTLEPGAVFIALAGESHDGHTYLETAAERGAIAAVVDGRGWKQPAGMELIRVSDTLQALQRAAHHARLSMSVPFIAITGSAGKTTTKETVAALVSSRLVVTKNEGNLNNHIGLPLSILRMDNAAQAAVVEMGMNHSGEIRQLAEIAQPTIGVVTNVGTAHIENFDSIEGVAAAKRELIEVLGPNGVAILNYDDVRVRRFQEAHQGRTVTFGVGEGADVRAESLTLDAEGASFEVRGCAFRTPLPGAHGVSNVLAGVTVGLELGLTLPEMAAAAAILRPGRMRGERIEFEGMTIWNDCYNSNPEAAMAMLDTLAASPGARKIAVLGEMLELGRWSEALHRTVGEHASRLGIDLIIGIRGAARHLATAGQFYDDPAEAGAAARAAARRGDVILFKGSRGTRVEKALERFMTN